MTKRAVVGAISVGFIAIAVAYYLTVGDLESSSVYANVSLRVGLVLGAMCLAWPTLEKLSDRLPTIINVAVLIGLGLFAFRPRVGSILVGLVLLGIVAHFAMKFASRRLGGQRQRDQR